MIIIPMRSMTSSGLEFVIGEQRGRWRFGAMEREGCDTPLGFSSKSEGVVVLGGLMVWRVETA